MKTDREFIEGIYQKAEFQKERELSSVKESCFLRLLRFNRENKRIPAFAASMATFVVFALVLFTSQDAGKSPDINHAGNLNIRTMDEQNSEGISNVSAYELGEETVAGDFTVQGEIVDIIDTKDQKCIEIKVTRLLCGEGTPERITITEGLPLNMITKVTKGTNVIASVTPILGQEDYALMNENSIYVYSKEENNQKVYEALDGTIVTEDSFQ